MQAKKQIVYFYVHIWQAVFVSFYLFFWKLDSCFQTMLFCLSVMLCVH